MFARRSTLAAAIARAEAAEAALGQSERRQRMIVAHATGGATSDISRSVNDICVDISRTRNTVFAAGRLADMTPAERNVLDVLSDELVTPIPQMAADLGVPENTVRTILRSFAHKGLVHLDYARTDGGEGPDLCGRGYCLTSTGLTLQEQSRNS